MNFLSLLVCTVLGFSLPVENPAPVVNVDFCHLQGAVFIEPIEAFATYRVFLEDVESFADLRVFKENTQGFADRPGRWYFTDNKAFADFSIAIVNVKGFAQFSIYYSEFQSLAGCR